MKEDYRHPDLENEKGDYSLELDIFLPKEKLAFEYQGEGHFEDIFAIGKNWRIKQRDSHKRISCEKLNITLVEVPYWWDFNLESLIGSIKKKRKDLLIHLESDSFISEIEPKKIQVENKLMKGEEWDGQKDLTNWILSEKFDGIRAYWDGKNLLSKQNKIIKCPDWFTEDLPKEKILDGEIWLRRNSFDELNSILKSNQNESYWLNVKLVVFDIVCEGIFTERMKKLENIQFPNHVIIPEREICQSNEHLIAKMKRIVLLGGEGLIANDPNSDYVPERTSSVIKVKVRFSSKFHRNFTDK